MSHRIPLIITLVGAVIVVGAVSLGVFFMTKPKHGGSEAHALPPVAPSSTPAPVVQSTEAASSGAAAPAAQSSAAAPATQSSAAAPATQSGAAAPATQSSAAAPAAQSSAAAPAKPAPADDVQVNDGGSVRVEVTLDRTASTNGAVVLRITMDTHAVDLRKHDPAKLGRLAMEPGGPLTEGTWKPEATSSHRVSGTLTFSDPAGLYARAGVLTLEIRDLSSVPSRTFRWQVAGQ